MKKLRFCATLLCAVMILSLLPAPAQATGNTSSSLYFEATGGKVYYDVTGYNTATIVGCDNSVTEVTIPATVKNSAGTDIPVTKIYMTALDSHPNIETLSFADAINLESIGNEAFERCTKLSSLTLGRSMALGSNVFRGCTSLETVTIPEGWSNTFHGTFRECTSLTSVSLPSSLEAIGTYCFENCTSLETVELPAGLEVIGSSAFKGCTALNTVTLPDSLETISNSAFEGCSSLTGTSLTGLDVPAAVTTVGDGAFSGCSALTKADLSACAGLSYIGKRIFMDNTLLAEIILPEGLKNFGRDVFNNCDALVSIELPPSLETISNSCFRDCDSLASVTIPVSCNYISEYAFYSCDSLQTVSAAQDGHELISIDSYAFSMCSDLVTVSLPATLYSIGEYAFERSGLISVTIPASIGNLGASCFRECPDLYEVIFPEEISDLTVINSSTFYGCTSLESITLPACVETVSSSAFYGCSALESAAMPEVESIGNSAFKGCSALESVTMPRVMTIESNAFENAGLTSISFPDDLTTIGSNAFRGCTSLSEIDWPANDDFTIVRGFYGCTSLPESVVASLPSSVETIGRYAFYGCSFSSVMIPSGVTVVERFAFSECNNLRTVTIPETVTKLEYDSFSNDYYNTDQLTFTIYNPEIELEEFFTGARYVELRGAAKKANGEDSNIKQHVERMNTYYTSYHYTFTELDVPTSPPVYTVSGVIPNGAEVKVHRGAEEVTPTIEGNSFTAEVQSGESVSMTVAKVGYYSNTLYKTADEFNGDWDIGTVSLIKLPETGRIYVEITRSDNKMALPSFDKLTLTLKKGEDEVEFTEAYPYIVITDDGIGDDDVLTLTVTPDNTLKLSPGTATSTREDGIFKLELPAWGNVSISAESEFAGNNIVLIFDNSGKLAEAGVAGGGSYVSGLLKNGNYQIVAYNASAGFSAVSSLAALADMGLTEGTDYSLRTVTVADKATTQVTLDVPVFNTTPASIIDPNDCAVIADKNTVVCGVPFNVRVLYSLTGDPSGGATVKISLPDGATLVNISNDSAIISVAPVDNTITLSITEQQGAFYLYGVTLSDPCVCSISASVTSEGVTAPLGSIALEAQTLVLTPAEIWLPEKTSSVNINCAPNTDVSLYVGNSTTSITATANARGRATITYTLPDDARSGQPFELRAESGGVSVTEKVFYAASDTRLMEFSFIHAGKRTELVKNGRATDVDYYTYIASGQEIEKHWTFTAVFESPDMTGNTVMLYITMMDESVRTETMTLIGDSAGSGGKRLCTYAADVYIEQTGDHVFRPDLVPVAFSVDWEYDQTDYVFDPAAVYNDAMAEEEAREQVIRDALGGESAGIADLIFGRNYIVSNNAWFAQFKSTLNAAEPGIGDETEEAFKQAEDFITGILDILSDIFETPDEIYDYTDMDDFIKDAGDGMAAVGAGKPGVTYNEGQPIRTPADITDMSANILKTADGTQTGHVVTGSGWTITTNYTEEALDNAKLSALGQAIGLTAESIEKLAGIYNTKTAYFLMDAEAIRAYIRLSTVSTVLQGTGAAFGVYTAKKNSEDLINYEKDAAEMQGYVENLEIHRNYYENHNDSRCVALVDNELAIARQLLACLKAQVKHGKTDCWVGALFTVAGVITALPSGGAGSAAAAGANLAYDAASNTVNMARAHEISVLRRRLEEARRERTSFCVSFDDRIGKGSNGNGRRLQVKLDPSGIVYEALESNPLEGVTATIYLADDAAGTNSREWSDAAAWDEVNPQITGTDGAYAWDVPAGWWQVQFTKDGYDNVQTAWMQVPPPRMNLKTAMVSSEAPVVLSAYAYTDYIEVIFSQYMDTSVSPGLPAEMTGAWQDVEGGFSKVLHITRPGGFTLDETVSLTISGAKNYAGTELAEYNSGSLTVSARPAELILNYDTTIVMKAGETPSVIVRVKDSEGNYMPGVPVSASITNTLLATTDPNDVTDANGKAVFDADALLPGLTNITFTVNGTSLTKTLSLLVTVEKYRPARPTAQIGSTSFTAASPKENYITVRSGEILTISAESGVTIFYTTDDTCPCQNSASRNIYTAPILLTENTKYRIAAYRDGMEYSERLNITVTISSGGGGGPITPPPSGGDEDSTAPPVWENPFKDVAADSWYYDAVAFVQQMGLFTGTGDDTFSPTAPMTRGMLVTVLYRLEGELAVNGGKSFVDVSTGKWYENAVIWAAQNRIFEGYDEMHFGPEDNISREQIATILWRYAKYKGYDMIASADLSGFNDSGEISSWAQEAMSWANANGFINGKGDGILDPRGNAERCQVAAILYRFVERYVQ